MERHYVFFLVGLCVLVGFAFSLHALTDETVNATRDSINSVAAFVLALVVLKAWEMWRR